MNLSLQVFDVREVTEPLYSAPTLDVLDDSGNRNLHKPAKPSMSLVYGTYAQWVTVPTATSYKLQRRTQGGPWTTILTVSADDPVGNTQDESSVAIIHESFYRVIAVNAAGDSPPSHPMFLGPEPIPDSPPEAPVIIPDSEVSWNITSSGFTARWQLDPTVTEYFIEAAPDEDGNYSEFNPLLVNAVTEFEVTGLASPSNYWTFRVYGVNSFGTGAATTVHVTPATTPAAPSNLTLSDMGFNFISLTWADHSNNESGFRIYGRADGVGDFTLQATVGANVGFITGLEFEGGFSDGSQYEFYVVAFNAGGESAPSNTIEFQYDQ